MSSNRDRRIDRLLPTLSAQERAVFVLRQYKSGADETSAIRSTMPPHQVAAFNRFIRLMNVANSDLGAALLLLAAQVRLTEVKYAWLMSLLLFGDEIEVAAYLLLRDTKDSKLRRQVRDIIAKTPGAMEVPIALGVEPKAKEPIATGLVRALLAGVRDGLDRNWRELRAMEVVVEEVAEEFDGEDPWRADTRQVLDDAKAACIKLCHDVQPYVDGFELAEPTLEETELVRRFVTSRADDG